MKKIITLFYCIFLIGFLLKFLHIHFNALIMIVGLVGILFISVISIFTKMKRSWSLTHLATWGWLTSLLIFVKFYAFGSIMIGLTLVLSVLALYSAIKDDSLTRLYPLGISILITSVIILIPKDVRFYWFNIKWNHEIKTDFITLDKYSWFLYQGGKQDKARQVSSQALEMAKLAKNESWVDFIEKHNTAIKDRKWSHYR